MTNIQQMAAGIYLGQRDKCTCTNKTIHHRPSTDNWKYAVNRIKKEMFSSTGVGLPAPDAYLTEYDGTSMPSEKCDYCRCHGHSFDFNSDPFSSEDGFAYRRQRSEHLLFRLTHILGPMQANILRLHQGVFVAQQSKPKEQQPPSQQQQQQQEQQQQQYHVLEAFLNDDTQFALPNATQEDFDSIFRFDYNNVPELISNDMHEALLPPPPTTTTAASSPTFIPYSYTVGARYTNPGGKRSDIMIRGDIPPWCQTFLLNEFYQASSPIKPNETRYGLIPFAPQVPLFFIPLTDKKDKVDDPELLLWYERLAMDTSDHELYGRDQDTSPEWETTRLDLLDDTLLCDISSDDAYFITTLGKHWQSSSMK